MHKSNESVKVIILGTAQDGGYPHAGCREECCKEAWNDPQLTRHISSLAILSGNSCWIIDITPDFRNQLRMIENELNKYVIISGIFITHAHMGHYMGLMDLGLEVMNTNQIPVSVMPEMKRFLEENAPFTQLIALNNIKLEKIEANTAIQLNANISIIPFQVPHRNEFSESVGFKILSSEKSLLYIPDIDSWNSWDLDINDMIKSNDILILDGTFFDDKELPERNIKDVPHPFINESLQKFSILEEVERKKVYFTHLNHTNPIIKTTTPERAEIINQGCNIAEDGMLFTL